MNKWKHDWMDGWCAISAGAVTKKSLAWKNPRDDSPLEEWLAMLIWALGTPGTETSRWKELIRIASRQVVVEYQIIHKDLHEEPLYTGTPWLYRDGG